jgi:hypothetical protein
MAAALKVNTSLRELNLRMAMMRGDMRVGDNLIGVEGAQVLAEALKENKVLRWLNVGSRGNSQLCIGVNNIATAGVQALAKCLSSNKSLTHLIVGNTSQSSQILTRSVMKAL